MDFLIPELIGVVLWELSEALAMIVFVANAFSVWLPNHSDNRYLQAIYDFLNRLSLNVLRNANRVRSSLDFERPSDATDCSATATQPDRRQGKRGKEESPLGRGKK